MKTTENNELIAQFIGMTKGRPDDPRWENDWFDDKGIINGQRNDYLLFDTSWDWLMPVIKICSQTLPLNSKVTRKYYNIKNELTLLSIEYTYIAVVEFIRYCNSLNAGVKPLPNRVFNSPAIRCANFTDGNHVNLIKLIKPYATGHTYAVYSTISQTDCKMYKTEQKATEQFNKLIDHSKLREEIWIRDCQHGR